MRLDLSVVIPCLNEHETLPTVIRWAQEGIAAAEVTGEIIIADNGSTDGSPELATSLGARVVPIPARGYGAALLGGIRAAEGRWIVMGDADASYDFRQIPRFVERLREGHDLVMGCRLPSGGGTVEPGAMPFLHRWWGNPMFSALARRWFKAPIHDVHCGMRGFDREFVLGLDPRCIGMEFASEMVIKTSLVAGRFGEVPITLHKDGRTAHPPHLRTFRDGWRHLRFYLMYSPRWLFLVPGLLLVTLGLLGYGLGFPRVTLGAQTFDVHTMLFGSLAILLGAQAILFAVFTKAFAINEGLLPMDRRMERAFQLVDLERGLLAGGVTALIGAILLALAVHDWWAVDFGPLEYGRTMRKVIPGVTLTALGVQAVLGSFFLSILGLKRR